MSELTLVVGDKNLSSWSMRPYLALRHLGVPFHDVVVVLDRPDTAARIAEQSPTGRVPVLIDRDAGSEVRVWDSLAIIEYLAERFGGLWPEDRAARAMARSVCAEMHSGFPDMRRELSMNVTARRTRSSLSEGARRDVARIQAMWRECRAAHGSGGPFLFGAFSAADCFFAPVATRFVTYGIAVDADTRAYMDALFTHPVVARWLDEARAEATETRSHEREH